GSYRWLRWHAVYYPESDRFYATARDITGQKSAHDGLTDRYPEFSQLRIAVDSAADEVYLIDVNGGILYVNKSACRELGYSYSELTSMTICDINPEYTCEEMENFWELDLGDGRITIESVHRRKDGSRYPVEISICITEYEGFKSAFAFARN
ncbi:MAG: PAS domain S-box protein, partial [Gammaproteobacteria bacterium]|nr:PAS domain S-box protein [Gammaproteobacteria bacterium]NIR92606.1 PAS domain S-box protein [Gammaproteobacteria bacterium]NIW38933.1 PAS domain S-box protein [candidate division Zixibacteria bacterium]NIX55988.1 PAS domain S-box protein [candidate division Zixibacteria bacterium]